MNIKDLSFTDIVNALAFFEKEISKLSNVVLSEDAIKHNKAQSCFDKLSLELYNRVNGLHL